MWPQGNGKKGSLPLTADINVTSLVDVAFTLLVIFIITAPIMQGGVEVQLPKGDVPAITQSDGIVVSVTREGKIYIGEVEAKSIEDFKVTPSDSTCAKPGSFCFPPRASLSYVALSECQWESNFNVSHRKRPKCCASIAVHWNMRAASSCFRKSWSKRCDVWNPGVPLSCKILSIRKQ